MTLEDHSRLIRDVARTALSPLGFQQKGRSRVWFADRGFWILIVEFQPSGFGKGSYLNIAAHWLWHTGNSWAFDYCHRAGSFIRFETAQQFHPKAEGLANLAAAEAIALDGKFASLDAIARYLKEQACDERMGQNPRTLYHAAVTAGLTGDPQFGLESLNRLLEQKPTTDWIRDLQAEATALIKIIPGTEEFRSVIREKVGSARSALKLPALVS